MARGPSGRLVIEVDPILKRDLHAALAADGLTLKDWFLRRVSDYIAQRQQPPLPGISYIELADTTLRAAETPAAYGAKAMPQPAPRRDAL
jgi:hypothetical protein